MDYFKLILFLILCLNLGCVARHTGYETVIGLGIFLIVVGYGVRSLGLKRGGEKIIWFGVLFVVMG